MSYYQVTESGRFDPIFFALFTLFFWWTIITATSA